MSSFSISSHSGEHNASVSYHTDTPGVSMTRAKYTRAQQLECSTQSPGPAAYYDKNLVKQSPMRSGIKFSLAKRPPSLFDVPDSRICPGPGAYDSAKPMKLGVAEFRSVKSSASIVKPNGEVKTATPHKPAIPSQYPTSAKRRSVLKSPRSSGDGGNMSSFIGSQSFGKLSDISNVSFGDSTVPADILTDDGSIATQVRVKSRPEDYGVDSRIINVDLWTKIRSKLAAACYTIHGLDKPALFTNGDKNHDGFLDLMEVKGIFRRVLKFPQEELSDKALRHLFVCLDTNRKGKLDFDHFFALLSDHETSDVRRDIDKSLVSSKSRPRSSPQKSSSSQQQAPRPVKQSRPSQDQDIQFGDSSIESQQLKSSMNTDIPKSKKSGALKAVLTDVERLRGDFDHQLEELGEIGKVIDKLITTMTPNNN